MLETPAPEGPAPGTCTDLHPEDLHLPVPAGPLDRTHRTGPPLLAIWVTRPQPGPPPGPPDLNRLQRPRTRPRSVQEPCSTRLEPRTRHGPKEVARDLDEQPGLPRSGHAMAALPAWHEDDALLFGGYTETARLTSQAVLSNECVWLIGGWEGGQRFLNDVWKFDLKTGSWSEMNPTGVQMPEISRFQAVAVGSKVYIHTHRSVEEIVVLDTSNVDAPTLSIEKVQGSTPAVEDSPSVPPSRGLHSVTLIGESLYLFGGAPAKGPMLQDLWRLDLSSMTWSEIKAQAGQLRPTPRCSHVATALWGRYLVAYQGAFYAAPGQLSMLDPEHELVVFDTLEHRWLEQGKEFVCQLKETGEGQWPSPRNASTLVPLQTGDGADSAELLLVGGWKAFEQSFASTHILSFTLSQ
eukprot:gene21800-28822_t